MAENSDPSASRCAHPEWEYARCAVRIERMPSEDTSSDARIVDHIDFVYTGDVNKYR